MNPSATAIAKLFHPPMFLSGEFDFIEAPSACFIEINLGEARQGFFDPNQPRGI
jgi:hypothetical protein